MIIKLDQPHRWQSRGAIIALNHRVEGEKSSPDSSAAASAEAEELNRRNIERRAVEAVIWGMPAVNYERMLQAAIANGAKLNQVVYWSKPVNWKNQTLTPNPDTIDLNPFYDTNAGPVVVEIPPADEDAVIVGSFDVAWQNALADVGPAGADKGKGGKYLSRRRGTRAQRRTATSCCRRKRTGASSSAVELQQSQRCRHQVGHRNTANE